MMRPFTIRRQRGAAIVEFALVLPFLLVMTMITTELGRALYQYNTIVKSLRYTARYLSVQTPGTKTAEAKNLVVYGNIAGTGSPLVIGLATSQVTTPTWTLTGSAPIFNTVKITVTGYQYRPLFQNVFGVVFTNSTGYMTYSDISATMRGSL